MWSHSVQKVDQYNLTYRVFKDLLNISCIFNSESLWINYNSFRFLK